MIRLNLLINTTIQLQMKSKSLLYSMAAIAAMGLATSSCSNDLDSMTGVQNTTLSTRAVSSEQFGLTTVDLLAGQHNDAGNVMIWNDYEKVYVQVQMENGWEEQWLESTVCVCLHEDGKALDYATLGEIIQEI